jgi:hypothetical protein
VFPGEELFFRQLVDLAGLLDGDHTALHCDDNRGLATLPIGGCSEVADLL